MIRTAFFLLAFIVSCSSQSQTETFDGEQFSFQYPKGWSIKNLKSYKNHVEVLASNDHPEEEGREFLTMDMRTTDGLTLELYFKKFVLDWHYDQDQRIKVMAQGDADINGMKAKWVEYQYGDNHSLAQLIYLLQGRDKFFYLRAASSSHRYPAYKDKFEGIVKSFKAK